MERYHARRLLREARVSKFEEQAFLTGILLLVAGVVLAVANGSPGGPARFLGLLGLGAHALCALSRGVRLSVLGMSRTREFAADAAAAALTGRPSALASALMKLESESEWLPRDDLRAVEARAVLSILGSDRSRLGPWFSTHPPTAVRVKRLEAIEGRVQAAQSVPHGLSITKRQLPSA